MRNRKGAGFFVKCFAIHFIYLVHHFGCWNIHTPISFLIVDPPHLKYTTEKSNFIKMIINRQIIRKSKKTALCKAHNDIPNVRKCTFSIFFVEIAIIFWFIRTMLLMDWVQFCCYVWKLVALISWKLSNTELIISLCTRAVFDVSISNHLVQKVHQKSDIHGKNASNSRNSLSQVTCIEESLMNILVAYYVCDQKSSKNVKRND